MNKMKELFIGPTEVQVASPVASHSCTATKKLSKMKISVTKRKEIADKIINVLSPEIPYTYFQIHQKLLSKFNEKISIGLISLIIYNYLDSQVECDIEMVGNEKQRTLVKLKLIKHQNVQVSDTTKTPKE